MKKKKTVFNVALFAICILVLLFILISYVSEDFWPFEKRRPPKKKPVAKEVSSKKKIPLGLAKEIMSQQRESSYNLRQLALGGIKSISINNSIRHPKKVDLAITATYADDSILNGSATFWQRDRDWYLVEVTRESRLPDPPLGTEISELTKSDVKIGKQIVRQQQENQNVVIDFIEYKIRDLRVRKVINEIDSEGRDVSIVDMAAIYENGKVEEILAQMVHHEGFWYLVKIKRR